MNITKLIARSASSYEEPSETPTSEEIPVVCRGFDLSGADVSSKHRQVNHDWWREEGRYELERAVTMADFSKEEIAEAAGYSTESLRRHMSNGVPSYDGFRAYQELLGPDAFDDPKFNVQFLGVGDYDE